MEPQQNNVESFIAPLQKVTPLSKYLALSLFIILPFLGGWIGYTLAPEKVVERVVIQESKINHTKELEMPQVLDTKMYTSPNGFTISLPTDSIVTEESSEFSSSTITNIKGSFGTLLISPEYIGMKGLSGFDNPTSTLLTTLDGTEIRLTVWTRAEDETILIITDSILPVPKSFSDTAEIQLSTTKESVTLAESLIKSINFKK